jgi:hypothetical protein
VREAGETLVGKKKGKKIRKERKYHMSLKIFKTCHISIVFSLFRNTIYFSIFVNLDKIK